MSQCHDTYEDERAAGSRLPARAADLMTPDPVVVEPTATVRDIAQAMLGHDIRMVPVVDVGGQLVGVVSESDLLLRAGYPTVRHHSLAAFIAPAPAEPASISTARREGLTAEEIMTTPVVTCDAGDPVAAVARRMVERDIRTLPVLENDRLVGVLSRHDLLRLFVRPDSEIRLRLAEILNTLLRATGRDLRGEVRDGVVILTGTVGEPVESSIVCALVRQIPGVLEVVDRTDSQPALNHPSLASTGSPSIPLE